MSGLQQLEERLQQLPAHELEKLYQQAQECRHRLARKHQKAKHPGTHHASKPLTSEEVLMPLWLRLWLTAITMPRMD